MALRHVLPGLCLLLVSGCVGNFEGEIEGRSSPYAISVSRYIEVETTNAPVPMESRSKTCDAASAFRTFSGINPLAQPAAFARAAALEAKATLGPLGTDRVMMAALSGSTYALLRPFVSIDRNLVIQPFFEGAGRPEDYLSANDFRNFASTVAGLAKAVQSEQRVQDGKLGPTQLPTTSQLLAFDAKAAFSISKSGSRFSDREVFTYYLAEFYRGQFTNRFGDAFKQPKIKSGIGNPTISDFVTVLLEATIDIYLHDKGVSQIYADQPLPRVQVGGNYTDLPGKFFPSGKKEARPTASRLRAGPKAKMEEPGTFYYFSTTKIDEEKADGNCGITEAETRAVQFLANYLADRFVVWSGGLLELLSTIDIGFVVGSGFAVGDNETLATVAKAAIEVISRRTAETFVYGYFYRRPDNGDVNDFLHIFKSLDDAS